MPVNRVPQLAIKARCATFLIVLCVAAPSWGQDQTTPPTPLAPQTPSPAPPNQPANQSANRSSGNPGGNVAKGTSKDRLFFTIPNFLTLENARAGKVPPLTAGQKFKVTARSSFDPVEFVWYGALAGISQWNDGQSGYGQGAQGYAKRYGQQFADGVIENFTSHAIFPSLLRQDPRYFQMGKGGFWHRTGYALSRLVVTRSDSGTTQFNFSEVLGGASAAGISLSYHPAGERTVNDALSTWATQTAYDGLSNVIKEFWPDIRRKIRKPKNPTP